MARLADLAEARARALGLDDEKIGKGRGQFDAGHLAVVVVASPKPSDKIPPLEQTLSAGAVCLALVNAATAAGWGANWLSGWPAHDPGFMAEGLGLAPAGIRGGHRAYRHAHRHPARPPATRHCAADQLDDRMILGSFLAALSQLGDPRFQRVLWLGLALTVGLLIGIYLLFLTAIGVFVPDQITLPWWGPVGGIDRALSWGAIPLVLLMSVFLMVPVASAFSGFFLDDVAEAVEARHYPDIPVPPRVPFLTALIDSVNFLGVIVLVNVLALIVYLFSGPFAPLVFWAVNGYLLGREYFTLAAMRHLGRDGARSLRKRHASTLWLAGALMAAPLSIPVVNLLVPVIGAATFTHLFHRLQGQAPSRR